MQRSAHHAAAGNVGRQVTWRAACSPAEVAPSMGGSRMPVPAALAGTLSDYGASGSVKPVEESHTSSIVSGGNPQAARAWSQRSFGAPLAHDTEKSRQGDGRCA